MNVSKDANSGAADYPYLDHVRQDILRLVPKDGKVIGTVGCGTAATEATLQANGRVIHGVDVSEAAIAVAASRIESARLIGPEDPMPFEPRSLDGLILADVIEHMPRAWDRLKELTVAVRKGGWVIISVPNMRNLKVLTTFGLRGDWPEDPTGIFDATHLQIISQKRLSRWCHAAGLVVETWEVNYLSESTFKGKAFRVADRLTFGLFRTWITLQWQCRCRVI